MGQAGEILGGFWEESVLEKVQTSELASLDRNHGFTSALPVSSESFFFFKQIKRNCHKYLLPDEH